MFLQNLSQPSPSQPRCLLLILFPGLTVIVWTPPCQGSYQIRGWVRLTLLWLSVSGLGKRLSLRVSTWLCRGALREGHRRVCERPVSERGPLSGRGEWIPVPVFGWILGKPVPGEAKLNTSHHHATHKQKQTPILAIIQHLKPPLPSASIAVSLGSL